MIESLIESYGLLAIFVLMIGNGFASAPPSEIVLPLAGVLAQQTGLSLLAAMIAAFLGNLLGTVFLYLVGRHFGLRPLQHVQRYLQRSALLRKAFRKVPLDEASLEALVTRFEKEGAIIVGLLRCAPYVRSIVSLPAGAVRMSWLRFLSATAAGISVWIAIWVLMGYALGEAWEQGTSNLPLLIGVVVVVVMVCIVAWIVRRRR